MSDPVFANSGGAGQPFDAAAPSYDAAFTGGRLGRHWRGVIWDRLAAVLHRGDQVLELGCGTGEDAVWLARRGVRVLATDVSSAMLEVACRKAGAAGVEELVRFQRLDLAHLEACDHPPDAVFDGALSNFGALNCLAGRRSLAGALARRVRPGGSLVLVVMGPWCPWEIAWFLLHGEVEKGLRRLRAGEMARVGGGPGVRVWYPSPRRLRDEFAPYFRHRQTVGLGVFLPPSYLSHLVEKWPRLFQTLAWLDCRLGGVFPWTALNDHYLMVLERV